MKNKTVLGIAVASLLLSGAASSASASTPTLVVDSEASMGVEVKDRAANVEAKATVRGNATSSVRTQATSTGEARAAEHRSEVAAFVQSLVRIADREPAIGARVRAIAKAQSDSASTSANAILKMERQGKLRTLLLGSDWKSLGQLRSDMNATTKNIADLKEALSQTVDVNAKAELEAQIKVLEDFEAKIDTYIKAHESSFSFFGWFTKRFSN